ncbi:MAG: nucleotide exchange factor GrpE [Spongiibacteraceae bacterium]
MNFLGIIPLMLSVLGVMTIEEAERAVSDNEHTTPGVEETIEDVAGQAAEQAGAEASEQPSYEDQIQALQDELSKTKDDALRMLADAQNIRRRSEKDVENARKFALEKFAGELLAVADNLERALDTADQVDDVVRPFVEGVALTHKSLLDTLAKFNIVQLDPVGEPFDPQYHQAMSMVENPDVEPNTVTVVMQKGYTINERLLRPAMVMVSKAASGAVDTNA